MPTITVDQQDHFHYYEDTGPPAVSSQPYTTLFIVHGSGFHSGEYSLRMVIPQNFWTTYKDIGRKESSDAFSL